MQQFNRLFSQKISQINGSDKTPVACAITHTFQSHQNILASARNKEESIQEKNSRIVVQNLKYRSELKNKQTALEEKSSKNRKDMINKIIKSEQERGNLRKGILLKHTEIQANHVKERVKSFREIHENMQGFWNDNLAKNEKKYRSQSAAKQLYSDAVSRKKSFEERQISKSQLLRIKLTSRLHGREKLVYNLVDQKQNNIHKIHKEKLVRNWQKHQQIVNDKINLCINNIGTRFQVSSLLLGQKKSIEDKKLEEKLIEQLHQKSSIKSNIIARGRSKSASLSECRCLKINNAQEGLSRSKRTKNSLLINTGAFNNSSKTIDEMQQSQFINSSQSFLSSVLYNKQTLREKQYIKDTERLQREKEISEALALKEQMKIQSNCLVRRNSVK